MNSKDFLKEGFVEDAHIMHQDHEVQMAREECYHAAENAIALHKLLRNISEQQGLDGWVSAKITLAGDYLKTVREYIEYELMTAASQQPMLPIAENRSDDYGLAEVAPVRIGSKLPQSDTETFGLEPGRGYKINNPKDRKPGDRPRAVQQLIPTQDKKDHIRSRLGKHKAPVLPEQDTAEGMLDSPGEQDSPVAQAIIRRILMQRTDLLSKYGPEKVGAAVDEVADFVGDVDEIGSSDVSGWVRHVEQMLGNMDQGVAEGMAGQVVFSGSGADGGKYEIIQTGPTDFMIHVNGKHIDTYSSLQRAMSVLKNEVPGLKKGVAEGSDEKQSFKVSYHNPKTRQDKVVTIKAPNKDEVLDYCANKGYKNVHVEQGVAEGSACNHTMEGKSCPMHGLKECPGYKSNIKETTAGSVAGVVNPTPKNKAKVGTLFGGTYKQKKTKA